MGIRIVLMLWLKLWHFKWYGTRVTMNTGARSDGMIVRDVSYFCLEMLLFLIETQFLEKCISNDNFGI